MATWHTAYARTEELLLKMKWIWGTWGAPFPIVAVIFKINSNREYPTHVSLVTITTAGPPRAIQETGYSDHGHALEADFW